MESTNEIRWKIEFKHEKPERFWQLVAIIAASFPLGLLITGKLVLAALVPICLFVSTFEVWRGKRFLLNDVKAVAQFSEIRWADVKRVEFVESSSSQREIYLSPFEKPNRLESTRGIRLVFPAEMEQTILEHLKIHLTEDLGVFFPDTTSSAR